MKRNLPGVKTGSGQNVSFLKSVEKSLKESRIPSAAFEAERLARHFSGMDRLTFFTGRKKIDASAKRSIRSALKVRLQGKPLSYILKETEFFGLKFFVSPDVLIPRPETEILVEEALKVMRSLDSLRSLGMTARQPKLRPLEILDIGTGCGCLAVSLTIQRPDCRMTALDLSSGAIRCARKNINFHGLGQKIQWLKSDLFGAFGPDKKSFWDMIVTNPPYVPREDFPSLPEEVLSEPRLALDGGPGGLSVIRAILEKAPYFLKRGGWLVMEIGAGQARPLAKKILQGKQFLNLSFAKDLNGIDRVLVVQKK